MGVLNEFEADWIALRVENILLDLSHLYKLTKNYKQLEYFNRTLGRAEDSMYFCSDIIKEFKSENI